MENKKKINIPIVIAAILLLAASIGIVYFIKSGTYKKITEKFESVENKEDEIQISEPPTSDHIEIEVDKEKDRKTPVEDEKQEIIENQEPLLDEKIDIADIYCVMNEKAVFYVYSPECTEYKWEYFNKKTADWDAIEYLEDVAAGQEIDEYNRPVATLTIPAKKDYDALEVRCVTDPLEDNETATGRLYVIEPFVTTTAYNLNNMARDVLRAVQQL